MKIGWRGWIFESRSHNNSYFYSLHNTLVYYAAQREYAPCERLQLSQAEEAFQISKTDLSLRPAFHQKTEAIEAHILTSDLFFKRFVRYYAVCVLFLPLKLAALNC